MRKPTLPQRPAISLSELHMALSWFAEYGDLLDPDLPLHRDGPRAIRWMLVPVSAAVLRVLAMLDAEDADLEQAADLEDSGDEHEPSLGSAGSCIAADTDSQEKWATNFWLVDAERDDSDREPDAPVTTVDQVRPRRVRRRNPTLQAKRQGDTA